MKREDCKIQLFLNERMRLINEKAVQVSPSPFVITFFFTNLVAQKKHTHDKKGRNRRTDAEDLYQVKV